MCRVEKFEGMAKKNLIFQKSVKKQTSYKSRYRSS